MRDYELYENQSDYEGFKVIIRRDISEQEYQDFKANLFTFCRQHQTTLAGKQQPEQITYFKLRFFSEGLTEALVFRAEAVLEQGPSWVRVLKYDTTEQIRQEARNYNETAGRKAEHIFPKIDHIAEFENSKAFLSMHSAIESNRALASYTLIIYLLHQYEEQKGFLFYYATQIGQVLAAVFDALQDTFYLPQPGDTATTAPESLPAYLVRKIAKLKKSPAHRKLFESAMQGVHAVYPDMPFPEYDTFFDLPGELQQMQALLSRYAIHGDCNPNNILLAIDDRNALHPMMIDFFDVKFTKDNEWVPFYYDLARLECQILLRYFYYLETQLHDRKLIMDNFLTVLRALHGGRFVHLESTDPARLHPNALNYIFRILYHLRSHIFRTITADADSALDLQTHYLNYSYAALVFFFFFLKFERGEGLAVKRCLALLAAGFYREHLSVPDVAQLYGTPKQERLDLHLVEWKLEQDTQHYIPLREEISVMFREFQAQRQHILITAPPGVGKSSFTSYVTRVVNQDIMEPDWIRAAGLPLEKWYCLPYFLADPYQKAYSVLGFFSDRLQKVFPLSPNEQQAIQQKQTPVEQFLAHLELTSDRYLKPAEIQVIFLLDGLDQYRDNLAEIIVLHQLPANYYYCCTTRPEQTHVTDFFKYHASGLNVYALTLPYFTSEQFNDYLHVINPELPEQERQALWEKSQGLQIYVALAAEILKHGGTLAELPEGVEHLYQAILEMNLKSASDSKKKAVYAVLYVLALARDYLSVAQLCTINAPAFDPMLLADAMTTGLAQISALVQKDRRGAVRLFHQSVVDYLFSDDTHHRTIATVAIPRLRTHLQHYRDYPPDSLDREYCLRYAARHFYDWGRKNQRYYDDLFILARDQTFLAAQRQTLPDDPTLPLRTLKTALQGAADSDNAAAMAEFLLTHARHVARSQQDTPLDALRHGSLTRALELAETYDPERCVKWYLLLIWELKETERMAEARTTLQRLRKKTLPKTLDDDTTWMKILNEMYAVDQHGFIDACQRLIRDDGSLCHILAQQQCFAEALSTAHQIEDKQERAKTLLEIAAAQAQAGDTVSAQTTFAAAIATAHQIEDKQERAKTLLEIAAAQAQAGDTVSAQTTFAAAIATAHQIKDKEKQAWVLGKIATAQAQAGEVAAASTTFASAVATAQQIKDKEKQAWVLLEIAAAQARAGDTVSAQTTFAAAIATAHQIKDKEKQAWVLGKIATAQAQAGVMEDTRTTLAAVVAIAHQIKDTEKRTATLEAIASAQAQTGAFAVALATAHQIKYTWAATLQVIYEALVTGHWVDLRAKALWEIATAQAQAGLVEGAVATAHQIKNKGRRSLALQSIVTAQVQAGAFRAALATTRQIQDKDCRTRALREIATAQAQAGEVVAARTTFATAVATARQIQDKKWRTRALEERTRALGEIATAQAQAGEVVSARTTFAAAVTIARQIQDKQVWVLRDVAKAQAQASMFGAAVATACQIQDKKWQAWALRDIAIAQAQAGAVVGACTTLAAVVATAQIWTLWEIAKAQAQAGAFGVALVTAHQIKDKWRRAEVLKTIAETQARAGAFGVALVTAHQIKDKWRRAEVLKTIAETQARAGAVEAALVTAHQIKVKWRRVWALHAIAAAQARAGAFRDALATAHQIQDKERRAGALHAIAAAQARAGAFRDALATAHQIKNKRERVWALHAIAAAQARAGAFRDALATAHQIKQDEDEPAVTLWCIAEVQVQAGAVEAALSTAHQIEDGHTRAWALKAIAAAQAQAGAVKAALVTVHQIEDGHTRAWALREITEIQTQADMVDAALFTAHQIEDRQRRARALRYIAIAQVKSGDTTAAMATVQQIEDKVIRAGALRDIATAQVNAHLPEHALHTASLILIERNKHLPAIAAEFVKLGDKDHFKRLLLPCALYLDAVYAMCGFLAQLYPKQATVVVEVFLADILQTEADPSTAEVPAPPERTSLKKPWWKFWQ